MWERIQNYLPYVFGSYDTGKILLELLLIGFVVYSVIRFLRGTGGERLLKGLVVLLLGFFAVNVVTREWQLERIDLLFKSFLIVAVLVALVAFQPELRRGLMRLGGAWAGRQAAPQMQQVIEQIVDAASVLSHDKIGALVALEREIPLGDFMTAGTALDADVTAELLRTIFWPGSPLHDMGVIIRGERAAAAAVQFPLAEHGDFDRNLGSRHRAAIGLSKTTDAVVVVVSEETGQIALAVDGKLTRFLTLEQLRQQLLDLMMPFVEKKRRDAKAADALQSGQASSGAGAKVTQGEGRRMRRRWRWLRTALIVSALSGVIWVYAERAVIKQAQVTVEITLPTARRDLLVQYTDKDKNVQPENYQLVTLQVEGPSRIVQQLLDRDYEPQIVLDMDKLGYEPAGDDEQDCSVQIISLLEGHLTFKDGSHFGITEAEPHNLHVRVRKLIKRMVDVVVIDERSGNQLTTDQPLTIEAYAPAEDDLHAEVALDDQQQRAAMKSTIKVTAQVQLPNRLDEYPISLKLAEDVVQVSVEKIPNPKLYIAMPLSMQKDYYVVIDPENSALAQYGPIAYRNLAANDYANSPYHLVLVVEERDKNEETVFRPLVYHVPPGVDIIDPKTMPVPFRLERRPAGD